MVPDADAYVIDSAVEGGPRRHVALQAVIGAVAVAVAVGWARADLKPSGVLDHVDHSVTIGVGHWVTGLHLAARDVRELGGDDQIEIPVA